VTRASYLSAVVSTSWCGCANERNRYNDIPPVEWGASDINLKPTTFSTIQRKQKECVLEVPYTLSKSTTSKLLVFTMPNNLPETRPSCNTCKDLDLKYVNPNSEEKDCLTVSTADNLRSSAINGCIPCSMLLEGINKFSDGQWERYCEEDSRPIRSIVRILKPIDTTISANYFDLVVEYWRYRFRDHTKTKWYRDWHISLDFYTLNGM
jgi:hypothetical protein